MVWRYILVTVLLGRVEPFRLKRQIPVQDSCQVDGVCEQTVAEKFGRSFWISSVNTQQDSSKPASTARMQGNAAVTVGLEFQPSFCGQRPYVMPMLQSRIVGGKEASKGQFPWQIQIWFRTTPIGESFFQCGGTLVSANLVVSAAHCFKSTNPQLYTVALGKTMIGPENVECQEQVFAVERINVHPRYSSRLLSNDIALLWIKNKYNQSAFFTDFIQPACLPDMDTDQRDLYSQGKTGIVSGWGLLNETGVKGSNILQFISLPILADDACTKAYNQVINIDPSQQFCAGNNLGQDACSGDSGGPFVTEIEGRSTLIGVVSFGKGCAREEYPGVYTKVHAYLPWILSQVSDYDQSQVVTTPPPSVATTTTTKTTQAATTKTLATTAKTTSATSSITTLTMTKTTTTTKTITVASSTTIASTTSTLSTTSTKPPATLPPNNIPLMDGVDPIEQDSPVLVVTTAAPSIANTQVAGPVCKSSFKLIQCPGTRTINIVFAFYGRQSNLYCTEDPIFGQISSASLMSANDVCSLEKAESYLKYICDRRTSCWIYNELFLVDPCPGKSKYSFVYFTCQ